MTCATDDELAAFARGALSGSALERVEQALDACDDCRQRLGALARGAERAGELPTTRAPGDALVDAIFGSEPPDPYVGSVLGGRYHVLRRLGRGGMGAVYEAEHPGIGRRVAIKLLHPELAARPEVLQRFRNEARAAAAIGHAGIVQALDVGRTQEGAPYLVLELLEGRDLDAELAQGLLPIRRVVEIGIAVADALAAAHAVGIVHRDLKPANVFLCNDGSTKVLDFGISKVRGELATGTETRTGAFLGTPLYMAPEQIVDSSRADARSDVYALGAILHRALSGRLPHTEASVPALLASILGGPVPSLRALRAEIPAGLDALVRRTLAGDPSERPATMIDLRDALRAFVPSERRASSVRALASPEERRAVIVLKAHVDGPVDAIERIVEAAGGKAQLEPDGSVAAVFGDESWSGDVVAQALATAVALARASDVRAVVVGPALRSSRDASLVLATETDTAWAHATRTGVHGAFVAPSLAHGAPEGFAIERAGELHRVIEHAEPRRASPLLGRAGELAQLDEAVAAAFEEGCATLVHIEAGPGLGKSRLLDELAARLTRERARVLMARTTPTARRSDLAVARALLLDYAGLRAIDRDASMRAHAAEALIATAEVPRDHLPYLAELLGAGGARPLGDARLLADRVRLAALEVLEGLARHRPLALLIDDAQWADGASLELLDRLLDASDRPIFLAFAARPPLPPELTVRRDVVRIRPRALRRHEVRRLIAPWLGDDGAERWAERLEQHTEGNPLFLEQLARAIAAGVARDDTELPLPPSVEGALQARLDVLDPDAREVLKRAAVLGEAFVAADVEGLGIDGASPILDALAERELVRRLSDDPERGPRYALGTPLLAEAAYRMLGEDARAELHRLAAERLTGRAPLETVGTHFERAGRLDRAASCFAEAAHEAARRMDASRVIACAEHALALGIDAERFALACVLAEAYEVRGRLEDEQRTWHDAESLAPDASARARVRTLRGVALQRLGRSEEALALFECAVSDAREGGDAETLARALGKRSAALVYAGRTADAAELLAEAERLVWTRAGGLRAEAAIWRAQLAAATGELGDRRNAYWAAVELYREMGDLRRHAGASVNLADVYNRIGAYDEAADALRAALEACKRVGMRLMEGYAWLNLGYAELGAGDAERAARSLAEAEAIARAVGEERLRLGATLYLAKVDLALNQHETAENAANTVREEAEARGFSGLAALAHGVAARAALARGAVDRAVEHARAAVTLRDELGGLEEDEGAVFLVLAQALEAAGDAEGAALAWTRGRAAVEATAARIGDRHWRERFVSDVPAHRALLARGRA
jgi:tetratricopeptide (TPR) repeat protein